MKTLIGPHVTGIIPTQILDRCGTDELAQSTLVIELNTVNPNGGRGGSIDSNQCAELVRTLAVSRDSAVIVATRHRSEDLTNGTAGTSGSQRILGPEIASILLAHPCVIAWVAGHRHKAQSKLHGLGPSALWELTPNAMEGGWRRIAARLMRER